MISMVPSRAMRFRDSMSRRTCTSFTPSMSIFPEAKGWNMKASSGSGLWPKRKVAGSDRGAQGSPPCPGGAGASPEAPFRWREAW